jgi:predicted O-linked N-acetylglucosamine transferase (SPINDLY family)
MAEIAPQAIVNELLALYGGGRFADMERRAKSALQSFPHAPLLSELAGMAIGAQYRFAEALPFLERAAKGDPADPQFWENLGLCQLQLQDAAAAEHSLRQVLALRPRSIDTLDALARVLRELGRPDEARRLLDDVAAIDPDHAARARAQREHAVRHAIAADPDNAEFHSELGLLLRLQGDVQGAEASMRRAIELNGRSPRAHLNLALLMSAERRLPDALIAARAALDLLGPVDAALAPDQLELLHLAAFVLDQTGQTGDALGLHKSLHGLNRDPALIVPMIRVARQACDWPFAALLEQAAGRAPIPFDVDRVGPGHLLNLTSVTAQDQLTAAQSFAHKLLQGVPTRSGTIAAVRTRRAATDRLRVSYFSRDYYNHPSAMLLAGVIEAHDRSRFEIVAHDFTPPCDDKYRRRLTAAFDRMIPIGRLSDLVAAERIASDGIDLVVDINGWTTGHRAAVLAMRPAPVQVQWLGHAGTMGAPWIDYIIADRVLIPAGQEAHYSEKIIRLPHTYQPTDDKRAIGEPPARSEQGLPDGAFVFCCFNLAYKFTPEVFGIWMQLLKGVEKSILWLLEPSAAAVEGLRREAHARDVDADRIVFAKRLPSAQHLGRLAHADLALDCFPYGSHTTASDALWAGVPLIALTGATFAARVSASILTAAGLPELITASLDEYHRLALRLAQDRDAIAQLKTRVQSAPRTSALFRTAGFTHALETAFLQIFERHRAGMPPDHIDL